MPANTARQNNGVQHKIEWKTWVGVGMAMGEAAVSSTSRVTHNNNSRLLRVKTIKF